MRGGYAGPAFRGSGGSGFHGRSGGFRGYTGSGIARSQVPSRHYGGWGGHGGGWGVNVWFGNRPYYHHHYRPYGYYPYAYYPYANGAYYPYYYDPFLYSYSSDNSSDYSQQQQQYVNNQLSDLSSQVQQLRQENNELRYDLEHPAPAPTSVPQPDRRIPESLHQPMPREPEGPQTVFIFKDGRQAEARNYAIVGKTLWILTEKKSEKVPISELDLDKTVRENEQRGVEFMVPPSARTDVKVPQPSSCANGCQLTQLKPLK